MYVKDLIQFVAKGVSELNNVLKVRVPFVSTGGVTACLAEAGSSASKQLLLPQKQAAACSHLALRPRTP